MRFKFVFIFSSTLLLCLASCRPPVEPTQKKPVLSLRTTACYGECPVFNLRIYEGGRAFLSAKEFLPIEGEYTTKLEANRFNQLLYLFETFDFLSFDSLYTANYSDLPTRYIYFRNEKGEKLIEDYFGAPEKLRMLEQQLIFVVKNSEWTPLGKKQ